MMVVVMMVDVEVQKVVVPICTTGKYCFPCVNDVCPFGLDPIRDCLHRFSPDVRELFEELYSLRSKIARMNGRK